MSPYLEIDHLKMLRFHIEKALSSARAAQFGMAPNCERSSDAYDALDDLIERLDLDIHSDLLPIVERTYKEWDKMKAAEEYDRPSLCVMGPEL